MQHDLKLAPDVAELLRCPICRAKLGRAEADRLRCVADACVATFPIVDGVPVLINEATSVFRIEEFVQRRDTYFRLSAAKQEASSPLAKLKAIVPKLLPQIGDNVRARENYAKLAQLLTRDRPRPRVLVLGGSEAGKGMGQILQSTIQFVDTDISFGPRTALICDAHDIPFADGTFDGVIAQAVLEHVADPYRCVEEIHRVLRADGLVYAETPFMQQVHGGKYDFTRFTHRGHRRLFRRFEEVESGACCGTGMALAWSWKFFLVSFVTSRKGRFVMESIARLTGFWLKYLDHYLVKRPRTMDAASAFYFLGKRSEQVLSDRDLIHHY
jgi:SAM-dependent methyltransferase/uncharacterized protein YbaR (Trm112 family)